MLEKADIDRKCQEIDRRVGDAARKFDGINSLSVDKYYEDLNTILIDLIDLIDLLPNNENKANQDQLKANYKTLSSLIQKTSTKKNQLDEEKRIPYIIHDFEYRASALKHGREVGKDNFTEISQLKKEYLEFAKKITILPKADQKRLKELATLINKLPKKPPPTVSLQETNGPTQQGTPLRSPATLASSRARLEPDRTPKQTVSGNTDSPKSPAQQAVHRSSDSIASSQSTSQSRTSKLSAHRRKDPPPALRSAAEIQEKRRSDVLLKNDTSPVSSGHGSPVLDRHGSNKRT